jgi:hypothetical protein
MSIQQKKPRAWSLRHGTFGTIAAIPLQLGLVSNKNAEAQWNGQESLSRMPVQDSNEDAGDYE